MWRLKALLEGMYWGACSLFVAIAPVHFYEKGFWQGYRWAFSTFSVCFFTAWVWRRAWGSQCSG